MYFIEYQGEHNILEIIVKLDIFILYIQFCSDFSSYLFKKNRMLDVIQNSYAALSS